MRTLHRIMAGLILAAAFYGSFAFVWSIKDNEPPIVYEDAHALSESVESGGSIDVQYSVFRKRICDQVVKRWLTDSTGTRHAIPSYTVGIQFLAGRETYKRSITIPEAAAVGPASYQVIIDYACNATQKIFGGVQVASPPITFDITPALEEHGPTDDKSDG